MGKKQHQKDKLYLTTTEWSLFYGGKKPSSDIGANSKFRRLPYSCCSLSLQPFENPYCTIDGHIFECENIIRFLKQYGLNPINGEKLLLKNLTKLNFFKNNNCQNHCPVTFKVFNENTHIVAVRTTGNVFSFDAVDRLNIKVSYWKDLLTDEPFARKDIITIQDPNNLDKFNFAEYFHFKKNLKLSDEEDELSKQDTKSTLNFVNSEAKRVLDELDRTFKPLEQKTEIVKKADGVNAAHYSTGKASAAFTSTILEPVTHLEAAIIDEDILRYERVKKKAYVQLVTSHGNLNVELHSDQVPKTCENFLKHCLNGYYDETVFHRSIKHFMIQGGDPEGTGTGGQSIWGKPFKDEFKPNLTHSGRGVLSMANSGPNTNKSQFFITFRSARHLDNKHTVFGRVVGGMETLDKMESIKTDSKDKPTEEIKILKCGVFCDPYAEADEMLASERNKKSVEVTKDSKVELKAKKDETVKAHGNGVGKYLNPSLKRPHGTVTQESETASKKKLKSCRTAFNFNSW